MLFVISCLYESIYVYLSTPLYLCFHLHVRKIILIFMWCTLDCNVLLSPHFSTSPLFLSPPIFSFFSSLLFLTVLSSSPLHRPLLYFSLFSTSRLISTVIFLTLLPSTQLFSPPLNSPPSTDSIQRQEYCKYSSYSQGFAFYKSIFSDVRYSTFR